MNPLVFVLALGVSHANQEGCGMWYMCGVLYPHQLSISNAAVEASVESEHWRTLLSFDGKFRTKAVVGPDPDGTFNSCGGVPSATCPAANFGTVGKEENLCEEYIWHRSKGRLELGLCLYHATFTARVPDWRPGPKGAIYPVVMSANKWNPGAVLGAGYGPASLEVKMCELRGMDNSGNNMPSICRGVLGEFLYKWTF